MPKPARRGRWVAMILAGAYVLARVAAGADTEQQSLRFVQGLTERGYHDLAIEYLERLQSDPSTPADRRERWDFEAAAVVLDQAADERDLTRRVELLNQAGDRLARFAAEHAQSPLSAEARAREAQARFERGLTLSLLAVSGSAAEPDAALLDQTRASLDAARSTYDQAVPALRAQFEQYPVFLADGDPRRGPREQAHLALMNAELQRALVDYEAAQSYPADSDERKRFLDQAQPAFQSVFERYRDQLAGFFGRMWEGKCREEAGDLGQAMGLYNELLQHPDPALDPLKQKVMYFQIIVDGKRGEHVLAVDRAAAWLRRFPNAGGTHEAIGVRFELAKNLLAQAADLPESEQEKARGRAIGLLSDVVRYETPVKTQAVALLRANLKDPSGRDADLERLSYDEALTRAETALSTEDWSRAIPLLRQAIRQADPATDAEKANKARYLMAYCCYQAGRYYEAAVLTDHLARRYPQQLQSLEAAALGLAAWTMAYNTFTERQRDADLERLVDLARYIATAWPDSEQADQARLISGEVQLSRERYVAAAAAFESVRESSPRRLEALVQAGEAYWRHALQLQRGGKTEEAQALTTQAEKILQSAYSQRREAGARADDAGLLRNLVVLSEVLRVADRPAEAIALAAPVAAELGQGELAEELNGLRVNLLTSLLRSYLATGQLSEAVTAMRGIESAGSTGASQTQLYLELGQKLKDTLDQPAAANGGKEGLERAAAMRAAYVEFLQALAQNQAGQTFDSLQFAADALADLGQWAEALPIYDQALQTYGDDPAFKNQQGAEASLLRLKLKKAECLRKLKRFAAASDLLDAVEKEQPRLLDPRMERGLLLDDWARSERALAASKTRWTAAYKHWDTLATQLRSGRPLRIEYYESIYHVAEALSGLGLKTQAIGTLKSVMSLSPSVGSPLMKSRYAELIESLSAGGPAAGRP